MVATEPRRLSLRPGRWATVTVAVACANRTRGIPGRSDEFDVGLSPLGEVLVRLARLLARRGEEYAVRQAAIWIVTDDASFSDLGVLVYAGGGRAIGADAAARAMRLVDEAGLPITTRRIWSDRAAIARAADDPAFAAWMRRRGG
jgi:hypothetical protein